MEQGIYFSGKCCVFFLAHVPPPWHRNHFLKAVFTEQGKSWCIHYQGSPGIFCAIYRDVLNERYLLPACQPEHGTVQSFSASALSGESCLLSSGFEKKQRGLESQNNSDKLKCRNDTSEHLLPPRGRSLPFEMLAHFVNFFISKNKREKKQVFLFPVKLIKTQEIVLATYQ